MNSIASILIFIGSLTFARTIAYGADFIAPHFETVSRSASQTAGESKSSFAFDPLLSVNPNRGTFVTEIPLTLPPSLTGESALKLIYQSEIGDNQGLGIGWRWSLPQIRPSQHPYARVPFTVSGEIGSYDLTLTSERLGPLHSELLSIWMHSGENLPVPQYFESYRPMLEDHFTLFVRLLDRQHQALGWVALLASGQRWSFSVEGLPIARQDLFQNSLRYHWSEGLLRSVTETPVHSAAQWTSTLVYDRRTELLPRWTPQGFYRLPLGLKKLQVGSREALFETDESGFLLRAGWSGGVIPLFQGQYELPKGTGIVESVPNPLKRHDDQVPYRLTRASEVNYLKVEHNSDTLDYLTDLNGDGRTDLIRFNTRASKEAMKMIWKRCAERDMDQVDDLKSHLSLPANSSTLMGIEQIGGGPSWRNDASLHLPYDFALAANSVETQGHECKSFHSSPHVFFLVDLNGDSLRDFVDCGVDSTTTATESEVTQEPIAITGPDGKSTNVNRRHSNIALATLALTNPSLVAGKSFSDPYAFAGTPARVSLQVANERALETWFHTNGNAAPDTSTLVGAHQWSSLGQSGFSCHQGSVFFDANHDGRIDILTGHTLYLASEIPGVYAPVQVNPKDYFEAADSSLDLTDTQLLPADPEGRGTLKVIAARAIQPNPVSGLIEIFRNGTTDRVAPRPLAGKLMTGLTSAFGGAIHIDYQFKHGAWVVQKIDKTPGGNQPSLRTDYQYFGSMNDPFRGLFVGFSKTRETVSVDDPRSPPRTTEREYYKDLSPLAGMFTSRARLNGRLMLTRQIEMNASTTGSRVLTEISHALGGERLGGRRILPYDSHVDELHFELGTKNVLDRKTTTLTYSQDDSHWVLDADGNRLIPLISTQVETGMGIRSRHSDQLIETKSETTERSKYFSERAVLRKSSSRTLDKDKIQFLASRSVSYDPLSTLPAQICHDRRCDEYQFDDRGRLSQIRSARGARQSAEYEGEFPLPKLVTNEEGDESRTYDPLTGRVLGLTLPTGANLQRRYSPDGILLEITGQENFVARSNLLFQLFGGNPPVCEITEGECALPHRVNTVLLDRAETLELDGFGRVEATVSETTEGPLQSGLSRYGISGEILTRTRPSYGRNASPSLFSETQKDAFGRLVSTQLGGLGKLESMRADHVYSGPCETTLELSFLESSRCINAFDQTLSQSIGKEEILFDSTAQGQLLSAGSLGIHWKPNHHSETVETVASFDDPNIDRKILPGATEWAVHKRPILDLPEGHRERDTQGYVREFNSLGKLVHAFRENSTLDAEEVRVYSKSLLKTRTLSIPGQRLPLLTQSYDYNGFGNLSAWTSAGYTFQIPNDEFGRPTGIRVYDSENKLLLGIRYTYQAGKVAAVEYAEGATAGREKWTPWITEISRDELERIVSYNYEQSLHFRRAFHGLGNLLQVTRIENSSGQRIFEESLSFDAQTHQLIGRNSVSSIQEAPSTERFTYDPETYQLHDATGLYSTSLAASRDLHGRSLQVGALPLEWSGDSLASAAGRNTFYDGDGTWFASCANSASTNTANLQCVQRIADDFLIVNGKPVILIRVENLPVAVFAAGTLYPIVSDHLGSIRAQLNPTSGQLLWERHYDAWGNKTVTAPTSESKALEESVLWSYAGLVEHPGVRSAPQSPLYWSKTRVYSPALREWLSVDPEVRWNPSNLIHQPGNWHSVRYAGNRPLEFVDTRGNIVTLAPAAVAAGVGMVVATGASLALGHSMGDSLVAGGIAAAGTFITVATGGLVTGLLAAEGAGVIGANIGGAVIGNMIGLPPQMAMQAALTHQTNVPSLLAGSIGSPATIAATLFIPELHGTEAILTEGCKAFFAGNSAFLFDGITESSEHHKEHDKQGPDHGQTISMPEFGSSFEHASARGDYHLLDRNMNKPDPQPKDLSVVPSRLP